MKTGLAIFICLLTSTATSQDTTYYDAGGEEVSSSSSYETYGIIERDPIDTNKVCSRTYFRSGHPKLEINYYPYHEKKLHGKLKGWYESGEIQKDIDYENGELNGQLLTYWRNGQLKRQDIYRSGKLSEGAVWDSAGSKIQYYDYEIMPQFPGGEKQLFKHLGKNIRYPKRSRNRGIQGKVMVRFVIEEDGRLSNIRVIESVNEELDAEAVRVIKMMPRWEPGKQDGENVRVTYNLPIKFTLA